MKNIQKYLELLSESTGKLYYLEIRPNWVGIYCQHKDYYNELAYYDKSLEKAIHWLEVRLMLQNILPIEE